MEQKPNTNRKKTWRKYLEIGIAAFLVLAAAISLTFMFARGEDFSKQIDKITSALAPAIIGAAIAYIVNPLVKVIERRFIKIFKKVKNQNRVKKMARGTAIVLSLLCVILLVAFLMYLLIPELISTVSGIIPMLSEESANLIDWFTRVVDEDTELGRTIQGGVIKVTEYFENFISNGLADTLTSIMSSIASGLSSAFGYVYNVVIGFVFSIYFLGAKETMLAQSKKILYAISKKEKADRIIAVVHACHMKFTGAISGKIVDSAIVGMICFLGMSLFRFPYAALISVIVGVTNVIPFFGPYIGAVPSALLILFADPIKCIWFIVFIIVLQQIDCNILDPRIVGGSIGLSPFWVLFSCVVFGSLWGIIGLLIGVPLMACVYMLVKETVENKLTKKGMFTDTSAYMGEGTPQVYANEAASKE